MKIEKLQALEILDSRGRPTLQVTAHLTGGHSASAQVPSGASTGRHEALELRDGDAGRYEGRGVRRAAANVEGALFAAVRDADAADQAAVDNAMIAADGTLDKSQLGANAILGVSCAVARAVSVARGVPLWQSLAAGGPVLPVPMINILSGGLHAGGNIEFQDFLAIPHGFPTYAEALHAAVAVHTSAHGVLERRGYAIAGVADEGGWGPALHSNEEALDILTESIAAAGFEPGHQVSIAIDVASSHFYEEGLYRLKTERRQLDAESMVELLSGWCHRFPVASIEDALEEDDWAAWHMMTQRLGELVQIVGDDFFTTNPARVRRGIAEHAGNAVLVKMNQIGTLTETFEVVKLARDAGWRAVVSARSGETEDNFLADLAVATGAGQIKVGSVTRSERLAKYNRLLEIERASGLEYPGSAIISH